MASSRDVQILVDTVHQFIAEQPPSTFGFGHLFLILFLAGFMIHLYRQREWKPMLFLFALGVFSMWGMWPDSIAYRMELNPPEHTLAMQTVKKGKVLDSQTVNFDDIARVEMQFDRESKRIAVISKEGKEIFPLGPEYIQDEASQYRALVAIQKDVGLPPTSGQNPTGEQKSQ